MVVLEQRGCWRRRGGHLARLCWVVGAAAKMSRNELMRCCRGIGALSKGCRSGSSRKSWIDVVLSDGGTGGGSAGCMERR